MASHNRHKSDKRWILALALLSTALPLWAAGEDGDEEGEKTWAFHGEVRFRGEFQNNYTDFNDDGGSFNPLIPLLIDDDNQNFFPYRVRVGVEGKFNETVLGEVQIQTGGVAGGSAEQRDPLFSNADDLDLYTGFIHWNEIGGSGTSMRFGRQEIVEGNEFLFGDLDFYNGISFDAYRLHWGNETVRFDFWWARTNETFQRDADTDILSMQLGFDADRGDQVNFYTHLVRDDEVSGTNRHDVFVVGFQWTRDNYGASHFIWNFEFAWEDGRIGNPLDPNTGITSEDTFVAAWGGEGMFGYNWNSGEDDHRVYGQAYLASGDHDATDNETNDFDPLFQDFHNRLGRADLIQGTNVTSLGITYEGRYGEKHGAGVSLLAFQINRPAESSTVLASTAGRFDGFAIPATVNTGGALAPEDDLGQEFDVWYDYFYSRNVSFNVLAAVFLPGDAITFTSGGFDDPVLRLLAQARLRF